MSYKRNQVEEAISRIFYPDRQKPPSELRTRMKRLLELDRSLGRKIRSKEAEEANFAFFSEDAPGQPSRSTIVLTLAEPQRRQARRGPP